MSSRVEDKILSYVSRETYEKYKLYMQLIENWNRQTSLIQIDTLANFMERHILDSLQLLSIMDISKNTIDIGTGAGFPGMVLAIAGVKKITLCDSNRRKTVFLHEIQRELKVDVNIVCSRVESLSPCHFEQVITRACSELSTLLEHTLYVSRETLEKPILVALKGKSYQSEIETAQKKFNFNYEKFNSMTDRNSVILKIGEIVKL
ncbi:16S rRNA (guanine(527)-N(7))-methyltransferase RsmG [Candidatus Odyssella thessalonicensis]|uniref:16S rRNA (guanine(527)-N(7))-methyltransferase RsmG n=1 Tax=Candidatus Odyssella thessalonicensis TaxID=84647 RepID=UPI000225C165|nr:16S rRNA (guanine(527)-N(7))-methyltransferase RsmG [Candidatus Odyssella thessalonicensis]